MKPATPRRRRARADPRRARRRAGRRARRVADGADDDARTTRTTSRTRRCRGWTNARGALPERRAQEGPQKARRQPDVAAVLRHVVLGDRRARRAVCWNLRECETAQAPRERLANRKRGNTSKDIDGMNCPILARKRRRLGRRRSDHRHARGHPHPLYDERAGPAAGAPKLRELAAPAALRAHARARDREDVSAKYENLTEMVSRRRARRTPAERARGTHHTDRIGRSRRVAEPETRPAAKEENAGGSRGAAEVQGGARGGGVAGGEGEGREAWSRAGATPRPRLAGSPSAKYAVATLAEATTRRGAAASTSARASAQRSARVAASGSAREGARDAREGQGAQGGGAARSTRRRRAGTARQHGARPRAAEAKERLSKTGEGVKNGARRCRAPDAGPGPHTHTRTTTPPPAPPRRVQARVGGAARDHLQRCCGSRICLDDHDGSHYFALPEAVESDGESDDDATTTTTSRRRPARAGSAAVSRARRSAPGARSSSSRAAAPSHSSTPAEVGDVASATASQGAAHVEGRAAAPPLLRPEPREARCARALREWASATPAEATDQDHEDDARRLRRRRPRRGRAPRPLR